MHLKDNILTSMDEGLIPLNIFLDIPKAFDTLDHTLLGELNYYGISDTELLFFENYLSNRKHVQIGTTKSTQQIITTGVPQGSILGPFLFLIHINDFPAATAYFDVIMYADDTALMTNLHINEFDNIDVLTQTINTELVHINEWSKVNKLSLNAAKSKYMMFHMQQRKLENISKSVDNTQIEHTSTFNFLGIKVEEHLKWDEHVNKIALKISKTIGIKNKPGEMIMNCS